MAIRQIYNNIFVGGTEITDFQENLPSGSIYIDEVNRTVWGYDIDESPFQIFPVETPPTNSDPRPYKVYSAIFTQSGTANPVVTVLESTFNSAINWARNGTGDYNATSVGNEFVANKTVMAKGIEHSGLNRWIAGRRLSNSVFQIVSYNNSVPADTINGTDGFPTFIEIRVYE